MRIETKWKQTGMEEMLVPELLNNSQFFPGAVEDFLQAWTLILQVFGFTPYRKVVTQNPPAGLFPKCCIMARLAFGESEKWPLPWERRKRNELSYLQMQ